MNSWLLILFLNELELSLHTSIVIVCTQLTGFKYCYQTLIILLNINHLFANSEVISSIARTNNFMCTQLMFPNIAI